MRRRANLIWGFLFGGILTTFIIPAAFAAESKGLDPKGGVTTPSSTTATQTIEITTFYPAPLTLAPERNPWFESVRVGKQAWAESLGVLPIASSPGFVAIQEGLSIGERGTLPTFPYALYVKGFPDTEQSKAVFLAGPDTDGKSFTVPHMNIGIGTADPKELLHVSELFLKDNGTGAPVRYTSTAGLFENFTTAPDTVSIALKTGVTIRSVGDFDGKTGISGGVTTNVGLFVEPVEGADVNYGAVFMDDVRIADNYGAADGAGGDARLSVEQRVAIPATGPWPNPSRNYGILARNFSTNTTVDGLTKYGIYIDSSNNSPGSSFSGGPGNPTRNYGLYITPVTGADENYGASILGSVGIGTQTPVSMLHAVQTTTANSPATFDKYNNSGSNLLSIRRARGTEASPTRLLSNSSIGGVSFQGYHGTGFGEGARIEAVAAGTWNSGDYPTSMRFFTTPDNSGSAVERIRIAPDGNVGIGIQNPSSRLDVSGSARVTQTLTAGAITATAGTIQLVPRGRPGTASPGTIYLDSSDGRFYGYNGTSWRPLDNLSSGS